MIRSIIVNLRRSGHMKLCCVNLFFAALFLVLFLVSFDSTFAALSFWQATSLLYGIEFSRMHVANMDLMEINMELADKLVIKEHEVNKLGMELEACRAELEYRKKETDRLPDLYKEKPNPKTRVRKPAQKRKTNTRELKNENKD